MWDYLNILIAAKTLFNLKLHLLGAERIQKCPCGKQLRLQLKNFYKYKRRGLE